MITFEIKIPLDYLPLERKLSLQFFSLYNHGSCNLEVYNNVPLQLSQRFLIKCARHNPEVHHTDSWVVWRIDVFVFSFAIKCMGLSKFIVAIVFPYVPVNLLMLIKLCDTFMLSLLIWNEDIIVFPGLFSSSNIIEPMIWVWVDANPHQI